MRIFRKFNKLFCGISLLLILQIFFAISINMRANSITSKAVSNRYFEDKFEISIPALPTFYDNVFINLDDVRVDIKNGVLIIKDLAPDQVYNDVKVTFTDNVGRKYELEFDNVITSLPVKSENKFVYDVYENGLGRKPDHNGFKFWHGRLKNLEITASEFVNEIISSNEFNSIYKDIDEKINALYKTIVGREPDEEGFLYWVSEFNFIIDEEDLSFGQAINRLSNRMISEGEFKNLVNEAGFLI